jgi:hypothetical protein
MILPACQGLVASFFGEVCGITVTKFFKQIQPPFGIGFGDPMAATGRTADAVATILIPILTRAVKTIVYFVAHLLLPVNSAYESICSSSVISPSGSCSATHASNAAIAAQYWQFG